MTYALALLEPQTPDLCPECKATGLIRDTDAGEVVCPGCGLVVDTIVSHGPEYSVYEPEQLSLVRATPLLIPALSDTDYTYLTQRWTNRDPEAQATMHRLRRQQTKTGDKRGRNFFHARKTLFMLGDKAHVPRNLLEQASDVYRRAYNLNLVRGHTIHSVMAGAIYATYRLQGVPRSIKELAEAMEIEAKELTRVYRRLVEALHLNPENPKAENYISRLADALHLTPEETRAALDLLREARRLKHTIGKGPQGLAAAAVYIAQLPRPSKHKISQEQIAQAAGVTSVTIRNRYKHLLEVAATLPNFSPVSPVSPFPGVSED